MDRTDKAEKTMTNIRHSDPDPPLQACHHRVQSTPAVIVRHHSAPSFACNTWGNEKTRRSYTCLPALNSHVHCIRKRRCTSCAKLSGTATFDTKIKVREWWGMFVDLSDVEDGLVEGVNESTRAYEKKNMTASKNEKKSHRHHHHHRCTMDK
eukprot:27104_1